MSNSTHLSKVRGIVRLSQAMLAQLLWDGTAPIRRPDGPAVQWHLTGEVLSQLHVRCKRLWAGVGKGLDLSGADLAGAIFDGAMLSGADFRQCNLQGSLWQASDLSGADFSGADLREALLLACTSAGTKFHGANLEQSKLCLMNQADFTGANLRRATFELLAPKSHVLTNADMQGCRITTITTVFRKRELVHAFLEGLSAEQRGQIRGAGGCFIATAACGTDQAEDVQRLREFRELVLRPTPWGRLLIKCYETVAPPVANVIADSPVLRFLVRRLIVRPARYVADCFVDP